jgi:hypothetical protein
MFKWIISAVALAAPAMVAAKAPETLAPLVPWNLHYGEKSCQLIRTFGEAGKQTTLAFERIAPRSNLTMMVYGASLRAQSGGKNAKATFLPHVGNLLDGGTVAETSSSKQTAILWSAVDLRASPKPRQLFKPGQQNDRNLVEEAAHRAEEAAGAALITALEVREPGGHEVLLQTGPLARPIAMMRDCANEQLLEWGVDPAVEDKILRRAVSVKPVSKLFKPSDYPTQALRQGEQSIIHARLNVGADGSVTKCTSLTRFTVPGFDTVVCDRLKRAQYKPAELADGSKVSSYDFVTINFVIPD